MMRGPPRHLPRPTVVAAAAATGFCGPLHRTSRVATRATTVSANGYPRPPVSRCTFRRPSRRRFDFRSGRHFGLRPPLPSGETAPVATRSAAFSSTNVTAGEQISPLPRRLVAPILLPAAMTISRASRLLCAQREDTPSPSLRSVDLSKHCRDVAVFGEDFLGLNAFARLLPADDVLSQARESDERLRSGAPRSALEGVPVTVKANVAAGRWWEFPSASSGMLTGARGDDGRSGAARAGYESDVCRRLLRDCGAVLVGITTMDEFGMGSLGEHGDGGRPTYNPVPMMRRLGLMARRSGRGGGDRREDDEAWLKRIHSSTPENPHGADGGALAELIRDLTSVDSSPSSLLVSPGGSSSGSAASVSLGSSLLSIGTDTGGSIRLPAAWTCVAGFKPTYGALSRYGVVSYASSLDTVGWIAGTAGCGEIAWRCLTGAEGGASSRVDVVGERTSEWNGERCRDSTAAAYHRRAADDGGGGHGNDTPISVSDGAPHLPLAGLRVGVPAAFSVEECPPATSRAWNAGAEFLANAGATVTIVPDGVVPSEKVRRSLASYYVLACAEASSNLSRYDGSRYGGGGGDGRDGGCGNEANRRGGDGVVAAPLSSLERRISSARASNFGNEVVRRVLAGTAVLSSDRFHTHYEAAARLRAELTSCLDGAFREGGSVVGGEARLGAGTFLPVDVMLVPTALTGPPRSSVSGRRHRNPKEGDETSTTDATAAFANDVMTVPISLGGYPAISVPVAVVPADGGDAGGTRDDDDDAASVVGLQIFGPRHSEGTVLRVARILEEGQGSSPR